MLMPIAYTFLRLADKIGPKAEDSTDVAMILLWCVGLVAGTILLQTAYTLWPGLPH